MDNRLNDWESTIKDTNNRVKNMEQKYKQRSIRKMQKIFKQKEWISNKRTIILENRVMKGFLPSRLMNWRRFLIKSRFELSGFTHFCAEQHPLISNSFHIHRLRKLGSAGVC